MKKSTTIKGPYYFIGLAGVGMSAIAQYLALSGEKVGGSDRRFSSQNKPKDQLKLEKMQIDCLAQNGTGVNLAYTTVVISTAIEEDNPDLVKAKEIGLNVIHRSEALAMIANSKKSICISGTSGKSTTTAMTYHILKQLDMNPSLLTGAGIQDLISEGKMGNADYQDGEYIVMEADESDGSLIQYSPYIGVCLNVDRDHKEYDELIPLFKKFRSQTKATWIVNSSHERTRRLTENQVNDFGEDKNCGFRITDFENVGFGSQFKLNGQMVQLPSPGLHNAYNAAAAISASVAAGANLPKACQALSNYPGIHRRMQLLGNHEGITIIDDYAHNPAKIIAALHTAQSMSSKVHAFFQPHGFAPTKFMRAELIDLLKNNLREEDTLWMNEIYYAGGTAQKDLSSEELINDLAKFHPLTFFHQDRTVIAKNILKMAKSGDVILLMGARDPSLEDFAKSVWTMHFGEQTETVTGKQKPLTNNSLFS